MKKKIFLRPFMLILFLGFFLISEAQEWNYINSYEGVSVYWRSRKEAYADKYIAELKLENNNDYKIEVKFKSFFICADGDEYIGGTDQITIGPNSSKAGQYAGLWYKPCGENDRPKKGGYRDMSVKEVDY